MPKTSAADGGRYLTPEAIADAIWDAVDTYYADRWNRFRGEKPPERDVKRLIDEVLERLYPRRAKDRKRG